MKITRKVITPIKTAKILGMNTATKVKFTKNETLYSMKSAMRIRKRAAKKYNISFNNVSLSCCLKEAYRRILEEKLYQSNIISGSNKEIAKKFVKREFGYGSIDALIKHNDIEQMQPIGFLQSAILNIAKLDNKRRINGYVVV